MESPDARKARSEAVIRALGVRIPATLQPCRRTSIRPEAEIQRRAAVLNALTAIGFETPTQRVAGWLAENGLSSDVAPSERAFLSGDRLPEDAKLELAWRVEGLWALSWVLGVVDVLRFDEHAGDRLAHAWPDVARGQPLAPFLARARLRPAEELLQAEDITYRMHGAVMDARTKRSTLPAHIDPAVIIERRRALTWCASPGVAWDDTDMGA